MAWHAGPPGRCVDETAVERHELEERIPFGHVEVTQDLVAEQHALAADVGPACDFAELEKEE